jgi:hypothetical protein
MWLNCKQSGNGITSAGLLQRRRFDFRFRLIVRKNGKLAARRGDSAQLRSVQSAEPAGRRGI